LEKKGKRKRDESEDEHPNGEVEGDRLDPKVGFEFVKELETEF